MNPSETMTAAISEAPIVEAATNLAYKGVPVNQPMTLEKYVRNYFAATPVMADVAYCESRFRQFTKDGKVIRGRVVSDDIGVMQINEYFHGDTAEKLGHDIYTLEGNLAYAKYLFEKQGTKPWNSSAVCWDK